jgi:hypothetical protein
MHHFTIFFITVNALHVSGGFSAHHQELENCTHSIWYVPGLLAATASVVGLALTIIKNIVKRCILLVVPKKTENFLVINTTQWDAQVENPKGSITSLIHFLSFKRAFLRKFLFDFLSDMNLCLCGN